MLYTNWLIIFADINNILIFPCLNIKFFLLLLLLIQTSVVTLYSYIYILYNTSDKLKKNKLTDY